MLKVTRWYPRPRPAWSQCTVPSGRGTEIPGSIIKTREVWFTIPSFTSTFPVARTVEARFAWRGWGLACFVSSTVGFGQGWLEWVGEKDAIRGWAGLAGGLLPLRGSKRKVPMRLSCAGVLILTCWAAVLLLLIIICNKLGSEQRVWGEDLCFEVGGVSLRWGRRGAGCWGRGWGFIVPWKWRSAQPRLLGLQQPSCCLVVLSAPLSF